MTDNSRPAQDTFARTMFLPAVGAFTVILMLVVYIIKGDSTEWDPQSGRALQTLDLRAEPQLGGRLAIVDARSGDVLRMFEAGEDGFMRTSLRILAQQRRGAAQDAGIPFRLTRWEDGSLSLLDPITGIRYELDAFGPDNSGAYASLLDLAQQARENRR